MFDSTVDFFILFLFSLKVKKEKFRTTFFLTRRRTLKIFQSFSNASSLIKELIRILCLHAHNRNKFGTKLVSNKKKRDECLPWARDGDCGGVPTTGDRGS